jgi:hypothetical protein
MHAMSARSFVVLLGIPLGLAFVGSAPGMAQGDPLSSPGGVGMATQQNLKALNKPEKSDAQPPSLPGTKTSTEAAPAVVAPSDMTPTDALFDAINRGDIGAARDAVNRGADLHGTNILGLTPLELSVDLGRNDISFMLLSERGDDPAAREVARRGGETGQGAAVLPAGGAPRVASRSRARPAASEIAEEPEADTSRPLSGDGGTPIPAAGFLGFGTGRALR